MFRPHRFVIPHCVVLLLIHVCSHELLTNALDLDLEPERQTQTKLELWSRGAYELDNIGVEDAANHPPSLFQNVIHANHLRYGSSARRDILRNLNDPDCELTGYCDSSLSLSHSILRFRGGSTSARPSTTTSEATVVEITDEQTLRRKIKRLGVRFGPEFLNAIAQNEADHVSDCQKSCELFYCASTNTQTSNDTNATQTTIKSYSMGAVPPEDFAESFGFPLDVIKVTQPTGPPLFSPHESATVIRTAEAEGIEQNEFKSGKYQLAGDWITNLPQTLEWFNTRLETTFFPLLARLFPEVVKGPGVLRAHSVSLLKYNASHPRTDVHIDNGILAMTLAMTPRTEYTGGGTYFEHMGVGNVLPMDVGHGTFRPGSVRHGGHRVSSGTRYILGAFLLIEDKVEHIRRLKNRGSDLRKVPDLVGAAKHFEWALAMNPKCTTCLKDWAEILHSEGKFAEAEVKISKALSLLENKDSDALFTLGVILSDLGRDDESIAAYTQSVALNAEDAELCFNLGVKYQAKGMVKEEMEMYTKATTADPKFGKAWINFGISLAEIGNTDDAELMFLKALECGTDTVPNAMMNLALLYNARANQMAPAGNLPGAKKAAINASKFIDMAKPLLDAASAGMGKVADEARQYLTQYKALRMECHRILGQIYAGSGDLASCETEFRKSTVNFPQEKMAWAMLKRILEMQGKTEEAGRILQKLNAL